MPLAILLVNVGGRGINGHVVLERIASEVLIYMTATRA